MSQVSRLIYYIVVLLVVLVFGGGNIAAAKVSTLTLNPDKSVYLEDITADAYNLKQMEFVTAAASFAVYNDRPSYVARQLLLERGWKVASFAQKINSSDVKFLLLEKQIGDEQVYILAVSGTSNFQDIKTDIQVGTVAFGGHTPAEFEATMEHVPLTPDIPRVHKGFAEYVQNGFFTNLGKDSWGDILVKRLKQDKHARLFLTGHSLGGAVAELLAARLVDLGVNSNQLAVISFGAPAVGNKVFVNKYEPLINLTRITLKGDIVKNLSQIANSTLTQFDTDESWEIPKIEEGKFSHSVSLYLDYAMKAHLQSFLEQPRQHADNPEVVASIEYHFPKELTADKPFLTALIERQLKYLYGPVELVKYRPTNPYKIPESVKYIVVYKLSAHKLPNSKIKHSYYIDGMRYVYDRMGNLLNATGGTADTQELTILEASIYTLYQLMNEQENLAISLK